MKIIRSIAYTPRRILLEGISYNGIKIQNGKNRIFILGSRKSNHNPIINRCLIIYGLFQHLHENIFRASSSFNVIFVKIENGRLLLNYICMAQLTVFNNLILRKIKRFFSVPGSCNSSCEKCEI